MAEFMEAYRKIGDPEDRFDIEFWQSQGPVAIFEAAAESILDRDRIRNGHAVDPKMQRNIEYFHRP